MSISPAMAIRKILLIRHCQRHTYQISSRIIKCLDRMDMIYWWCCHHMLWYGVVTSTARGHRRPPTDDERWSQILGDEIMMRYYRIHALMHEPNSTYFNAMTRSRRYLVQWPTGIDAHNYATAMLKATLVGEKGPDYRRCLASNKLCLI